MKKDEDTVPKIEPCYNDVVKRRGCAACVYRNRNYCSHPIVNDQFRYQLRGNLAFYVENSCVSGDPEIRPAWCPTFSQTISLLSETKNE